MPCLGRTERAAVRRGRGIEKGRQKQKRRMPDRAGSMEGIPCALRAAGFLVRVNAPVGRGWGRGHTRQQREAGPNPAKSVHERVQHLRSSDTSSGYLGSRNPEILVVIQIQIIKAVVKILGVPESRNLSGDCEDAWLVPSVQILARCADAFSVRMN